MANNLLFRAVRKAGRIWEQALIYCKIRLSVLFGSKFTKKQVEMVILDDLYPSIMTQFRVLEFEKYLKRYNTLVFSSDPNFKQHLSEYITYYPDSKNKIYPYKGLSVKAKLAFFVFINNGIKFLDFLEQNKIPFVFILYPGGGFALNNPQCDKKLRRVFSSPYFRKVLVAQNITHDYLLNNNLCPADKIVRIKGSPYQMEAPIDRNDAHRTTFDVAFCAAKYMPQGRDKGYDLFIETLKILQGQVPNLRAHVIGPYSAEDYDISGLEEVLLFHGSQPLGQLRRIFAGVDAVISPNRMGLLNKGSFDGFPTGAVAVGGMEGAAMFLTDELGQNDFFEPDQQIVLIDHNPQHIAQRIKYFYDRPELLAQLKANGQERLCELTSDAVQMPPRYEVLDALIQTKNDGQS